MENNWFEYKVSYEKILENGVQKKVTEAYLVDALSFTEAEARIVKQIKPFINGEFSVVSIRYYPLAEVFLTPEGDRYFIFHVNFIALDERTGGEKRTKVKMLAQASSITQAREVFDKGMTGTLSDYEVEQIGETKLMDVFPI